MGRPETQWAGVGSVFFLQVNNQGNIIGAEGSREEPLGLRLRDLVGTSIFELFSEAPELQSRLERAARGERWSSAVMLRGRKVQLSLGRGKEAASTIVVALEAASPAAAASTGAVKGIDAYLPLIVRQMPSVVWATDRDLRVSYAVGCVPGETSIDAGQLIGCSIRDLVGTSDPTHPIIAHCRAALAGETQQLCHTWAGRIFDVLLEPLWDPDGMISGSLGVAVDVTERERTAQELAQSLARLAEAQQLAHVGSWEWDTEANVVRWSDELYRIYGLAKMEFAGTFEAFLDRVHPDDRGRAKDAVLGAFRERRPFSYDHRIVRPDGSVRMLQTRGDVVLDDRGRLVRMSGSCWDVTEHWLATQHLERSVSLLEATLEATADGLLVVDRGGTVVAFNKKFLSFWGIPPELAEGRSDEALLAFVNDKLEDPEDFLRTVRDLYGHPEKESVHVLHFKDGRIFERYSRPQRVGEQIVGRVWSFRDVTERERMLHRATFLADASRLLATLDVERALEAVARLAVPFIADVCAVDLVDEEGSLPRRLVTVTRGASAGVAAELHPSALAGYPVLFSEGPLAAMAVPFVGKHAVLGAMTFIASAEHRYFREELKLAQELAYRAALAIERVRLYAQAQEALRARDEFLSIAAHEIRGPLTSIHLGVESLQQQNVPRPDMPRVLDILLREERRLAQFITDMLEFGRIRSGSFHLEIEQVDLVQVVSDVVQRLSGEIARSGSSIVLRSEGPVIGSWDRLRLDQVVNNLLSNAIKFGRGRPIEIEVHSGNGRATLIVRDHGIGIPEEMQQRVFDPFVRTVPSRQYGGLGLGLYIVRTIVTGLGGEVRAASSPGAGTSFIVELPRARPK